MDQLQLTPAKILYYIRELYKKGLIEEKQRIQLKEFLIQDDPQLYEFFESYERDQNEKLFAENLISRIKFQKKNDSMQSHQTATFLEQ